MNINKTKQTSKQIKKFLRVLGIVRHFWKFIKIIYQIYSKHPSKRHSLTDLEKKQRCPLSLLLFSMVLEALASAKAHEKEIRASRIERITAKL